MANGKRFRWLKWLVTLLLIGGAAGGGYYWYQQRRGAGNGSPYQTAFITRGELTQVVMASGTLNPVLNVQVGSQISGTIQKLFVDFNSLVTNGQVVAQIEPSTYKANVAQATADLANARAALELMEINARRAKELCDNKLIPQSDYDTAVASLHQAEAVVMNKQAVLDRSKVDLDRCTICSPISGIVISRNVDVGQTVAASLSAPTIFVIANDLTKMQIDANVAEADIGGVETNQNVDFTVDAFPNRTFHGKVTQVRNSPITVQNVVSYDTVIEVSNPDYKLKPGMTANVSVIIAQRDNVLKLPNPALRFRPPDAPPAGDRGSGGSARSVGGGPGSGRPKGERKMARTVYVPGDDGKAKATPIKIGISDGIFTEVVEGLSESNKVITGQIVTQTGAAAPAASPFGGGMRLR